MKAGAVVVAAGSGARFGAGDLPKQFQRVQGRPLVAHAIRSLIASGRFARLVVVLPARRFAGWRELLGPSLPDAGAGILSCPGGATRQESTIRGLDALDEAFRGEEGTTPDLVAVHDGARPAPSASLIRAVVEAAERDGAAIPGIRPADTLWRLGPDETAEELVDRETTVAVQTPQCFRRDLLRDALDRAAAEGRTGTDEASAVRALGHAVRVVPGSPHNVKVTRPPDLDFVRGQLEGVAGFPRIGSGFDVHRFGAGGTLRLGGVEFPGVAALEGHSDGDALLHALADAILGAIAAPDLGKQFPSTDPSLRGAASERFVARAVEVAAQAGYAPGQVDLTVIAARPRLAPRASEIRERIATLLGVPPDAVGLKATTTDGLGFTGRGEGLAAQAFVRLDPVGATPDPGPEEGSE